MINYILGTVEVSTDNFDIISVLAENNIQCSKITGETDNISFRIPLFQYRKFKSILEKEHMTFHNKGLFGFPQFIYKYKKRYGMFIGTIIFMALLSLSGKYIWSFSISGNSTVSDTEILTILDNLGCGVGSRIDSIDFDVLHNKFLIECSDVAWISVNMDGTCANVEIRETDREKGSEIGNHNIIAKEDGQIELITVIDGKAQVSIGDVVKKGDLLISGIETYREGEKNYYTSADGSILATVYRKLNFEMPSEQNRKIYTGNTIVDNSIKFFGFEINLFRNSSIQYNKYDIITENRQVVLFDCVELPLWLKTDRICEYLEQSVTIPENELRSSAIKEFKESISEISAECELVSMQTNHSFDNGVYRIECDLYCITDIAEKIPYSLENKSQEE